MNERLVALSVENLELRRVERGLILLMSHIAQGRVSVGALEQLMPRRHRRVFHEVVAPRLDDPARWRRNRALVLAFHLLGVSSDLTAEVLLLSPRTVRRCIDRFERGDRQRLLEPPARDKKRDRTDIRDKLFEVLHAPPSSYDINRTTWTIDLLHDVLRDEGVLVGKNTISAIIRAEGFVFRKTREVLTSSDPNYREKLERITRTLRHLGTHPAKAVLREAGCP